MSAADLGPWLSPHRETMLALVSRGSHAIMLHGPAGTGKWDLAMALARDLLCEAAKQHAPACGVCASCHLFAAGNHPDLRVLVPDAMAERRPGGSEDDDPAESQPETGTGSKSKPSREIKIDQVRQLSTLTAITAHRGGFRVVVLAPAEALNLPAANALLKGLEEPPPATVFLLVADHVDRCLPTILSRCTLVRVPLPEAAAATQWLTSQGLQSEDAQRRLREAGGAPYAAVRDAGDHALTAEHRETLLSMLRRGAQLSPAQVAVKVPRTLALGPAVSLFQRWGWDYFSYRLGGSLRYHPEDSASFAALARNWSPQSVAAWLVRLRDLQRVADHPLNARSAIEGVLLDYIGSIAEGGMEAS